MNQELLTIIKSIYELDRYFATTLHIHMYNPKGKDDKRNCWGLDCNYCPLASYTFKTDHLKETLIQITTLSWGFAPVGMKKHPLEPIRNQHA